MWETLNMKMWRKPFNQAPVIGYMADLHTLKADDLRAWYKQWYAPNNAMLVIAGDVKRAGRGQNGATHFRRHPRARSAAAQR